MGAMLFPWKGWLWELFWLEGSRILNSGIYNEDSPVIIWSKQSSNELIIIPNRTEPWLWMELQNLHQPLYSPSPSESPSFENWCWWYKHKCGAGGGKWGGDLSIENNKNITNNVLNISRQFLGTPWKLTLCDQRENIGGEYNRKGSFHSWKCFWGRVRFEGG